MASTQVKRPENVIFGTYGTWIEPEEVCYPHAKMIRKCVAHLDTIEKRGLKIGITCYAGIPDTAFSIPAFRLVNGKREKGYVYCEEGEFMFRPNNQPIDETI